MENSKKLYDHFGSPWITAAKNWEDWIKNMKNSAIYPKEPGSPESKEIILSVKLSFAVLDSLATKLKQHEICGE